MSERQRIIEQERKGVLELMLKKSGLTREQQVFNGNPVKKIVITKKI